jgi:hypothetical protein
MSGTINKGRILGICVTPQADDLTQTEFEALTYVPVANVVSIGETGNNENVVSQDYHGTIVTQKRKGIINAGDPTIELGYTPADLGYQALVTAAGTDFFYAVEMEMNDAPDASTTNTIKYNRGLVLGPVNSNGGVEDWDNRTFTLGLVQEQIEVAPEAII